MKIRDNNLAKFISARRWLRRLGLFVLPEQVWVESRQKKLHLSARDLRGPSYHVLNWGVDSYESENVDLLKGFLKNIKDPYFFDIGANVGIFSFVLSCDVPGVKIFMFEPEEVAFRCLQATFDKTHFPNSKIYKYAVSDIYTQVSLHSDSENHGGHSLHKNMILEEGNSVHKTTSVGSVSLDQFVTENNIKKLDALKMDIQGHEGVALEGAKNVLQKFRPLVLMECYIKDLVREDSKLLAPFLHGDYLFFEPKVQVPKPVSLENIRQGFGDLEGYVDLVFVGKEKLDLVTKKNTRQ